MDDIRNVISCGFAMSQNKIAMVVYMELLGEMMVHYDNIYKIEKGLR